MKADIVIDPLPEQTSRSNGPYVAVLFDLDGTLIDTTDLIFQSYQHALTGILDRPATTDELLRGYGQPLTEAFTAILAEWGGRLPPGSRRDLIDRLIVAYREFNVAHHDALAREFPSVRSTLEQIDRRGYPIGLVTSKSRAIAERGLKLIGIADWFRTAVFQEDTVRHKPNPDPLWEALDRLGLRDRSDRVMYVGDSTHDLNAGRAAGVKTAAALWGPFPPESLFALAPTHALLTVPDLLDLFPPMIP